MTVWLSFFCGMSNYNLDEFVLTLTLASGFMRKQRCARFNVIVTHQCLYWFNILLSLSMFTFIREHIDFLDVKDGCSSAEVESVTLISKNWITVHPFPINTRFVSMYCIHFPLKTLLESLLFPLLNPLKPDIWNSSPTMLLLSLNGTVYWRQSKNNFQAFMAYNEKMGFKLEVTKHPSFIRRPKNK